MSLREGSKVRFVVTRLLRILQGSVTKMNMATTLISKSVASFRRFPMRLRIMRRSSGSLLSQSIIEEIQVRVSNGRTCRVYLLRDKVKEVFRNLFKEAT